MPYTNPRKVHLETFNRKCRDAFELKKTCSSSQYVMSMDNGFPYRIVRRGLDVTPKTYRIPGVNYANKKEVAEWMNYFNCAVSKLFCSDDDSDQESVLLGSEEFRDMIEEAGPMERLDMWSSEVDPDKNEVRDIARKAPSKFHIREDPEQVKPKEIYRIRLRETDTLVLLDISTILIREGGEEEARDIKLAILQEETRVKNNRLIIVPYENKFTQMFRAPVADNLSLILSAKRSNASVDVYESDRKKTFTELGLESCYIPRRTKMVRLLDPLDTEDRVAETDIGNGEEPDSNDTPEELKLFESLNFFKSVTVMERMLSSNLSLNLQIFYEKGLYTNEAAADFKYTPELLWTFHCPQVWGKAVTGISWNNCNPHIFAVSYGKYLFHTNATGAICIWSVKNTEHPERISIFEDPVTFVEFSKKSPRILSVSFWNGTVALMDAVLKEPDLLVRSSPRVGFCLPVHQFKWFEISDAEYLVSCGEIGDICLFKPDVKFDYKRIMKIRRVGNTVCKGAAVQQRKPVNTSSPIGPAALVLCQHPKKDFVYLVGTDTGLVYICSSLKHNKHTDIFAAHGSAVTSIQFNPVEDRLLLTAGCDFYIRVWIYDHFETFLFQFMNRLSYVDGAVWNPVHPYMIVSAVNCFVEVWHIKKSIFEPVSVVENPHHNRNLIVSFNPTGTSFLVGDIKGCTYVYSFSSIPKPPKDGLKKLAEAILYALEYDKDRLKIENSCLVSDGKEEKFHQDKGNNIAGTLEPTYDEQLLLIFRSRWCYKTQEDNVEIVLAHKIRV